MGNGHKTNMKEKKWGKVQDPAPHWPIANPCQRGREGAETSSIFLQAALTVQGFTCSLMTLFWHTWKIISKVLTYDSRAPYKCSYLFMDYYTLDPERTAKEGQGKWTFSFSMWWMIRRDVRAVGSVGLKKRTDGIEGCGWVEMMEEPI